MCFKINVFIVVSHIGDTYPEDECGHSRQGGYDPSTYQWVGFWFSVYTYILILFPESEMKRLFVYMPCIMFAVCLCIVSCIYICMFGAANAQVSARWVVIHVYIQ